MTGTNRKRALAGNPDAWPGRFPASPTGRATQDQAAARAPAMKQVPNACVAAAAIFCPAGEPDNPITQYFVHLEALVRELAAGEG